MFSKLSKLSLAKALLFKNTPVYVQFYITARCNLACKQCNIINANSDVRECTLDEIKVIADNLATLGVANVLLTGGEPFCRADLPEIIREFEGRGVHVRMQTNGFAAEELIHKAIEYGGKDISISLDTLDSGLQEQINGGIKNSWHSAVRAMACFSRYLDPDDSFAALGCVLQRSNVEHIANVIEFGTQAGWYTSLVPVHVASCAAPRNFRTYDQAQRFSAEDYPAVDTLIERIRAMRKQGYLLYDSDVYLDDIKRFVRGEPITWRRKNHGVCDAHTLYFSILPDGAFVPCCDYRLRGGYYVQAKGFSAVYRSQILKDEVRAIASVCDGCMYGSYPEISISMRYMKAIIDRARLFVLSPPKKPWPKSYEDLLGLADSIRNI